MAWRKRRRTGPAAAFISLDILRDGVSNVRRAIVDLMDQTPTTIEEDDVDPLRDKLASIGSKTPR